jgi:YVTN family beta-propeller protein
VRGYTLFTQERGDEAAAKLAAKFAGIARQGVEARGGSVIELRGDEALAVFGSPRQAIRAAVDLQQRFVDETLADPSLPLMVGIGLDAGEAVPLEGGYRGGALNLAARLCGQAGPGEVLTSPEVVHLARAVDGIRYVERGEVHLKGLAQPVRIIRIVPEGDDPAVALAPLTAARRPPPPPRSRLRSWKLVAAAAAVVVAVAVMVPITLLGHGGNAGGCRPAADVSADSVGIFQPGNGCLTGQISLGASPSAIAAGDGSIWVTNVDAHSVSRVDPVRGVTIQTIQVGNGPAGVAFGGGFVWVTNSLDGTVSQLDPQTDTRVNTIPVGNGPVGVAADARNVWVANSDDGTVTQIDERTGTPRAPIPVGQSADGIAVGGGSVWVSSESTGTVTRIDRSGNVVQSRPFGSGATAVALGQGAVWVANNLDGTVTRVDPASNSVLATIPVGDGPSGIAVTSTAVWVSNELAGTLSRIDPVRNVATEKVTTGNRPEGIVVTGNQMFVAVRASGAGHRGGTLKVLEPFANFISTDPAASDANTKVLPLTNDGLTGFRRVGGSAGTSLVPDLAVSLPAPSAGGRSYTFQLRPGIRYSTGALVQPQDFRRAIERSLVLNGEQGGYYAGVVGAQACLAAPNKPCDLSQGIVADPASNTVTFRLTSPDPDLLYQLALPSAYAVPAATPLHPHLPLPATGPYEIASLDPNGDIRLIRNPMFSEWSPAAQPSGFPDVIVERFGGTPDAAVTAVVSGSADLAKDAERSSTALLDSVRTQHASQLEATPWDSTWFLVLNTQVPPFNDRRVRQALNFAVDRAHLRDLTLGQGLGQVTCQVLPPDFPGYQPYCPYTANPSAKGAWTAPDLKRARQLVESSGTAGKVVTVWIPRWIHFGPDAGRYVVSVLDSLHYKARFRFAKDPLPHGGQAAPAGGLLRLGPGLRDAGQLHRHGPHLRRELRERQHRRVLRPGDRPRDRAPGRFRSAIPRRRHACGPRSTTTSPTRRPGSRSRTASCSRSSRPGSATTNTTPSGARCSTRCGFAERRASEGREEHGRLDLWSAPGSRFRV